MRDMPGLNVTSFFSVTFGRTPREYREYYKPQLTFLSQKLPLPCNTRQRRTGITGSTTCDARSPS